MLVFKKDGDVKFIDPASSLIEKLEHAGWALQTEKAKEEPKPEVRRGRKKKELSND